MGRLTELDAPESRVAAQPIAEDDDRQRLCGKRGGNVRGPSFVRGLEAAGDGRHAHAPVQDYEGDQQPATGRALAVAAEQQQRATRRGNDQKPGAARNQELLDDIEEKLMRHSPMTLLRDIPLRPRGKSAGDRPPAGRVVETSIRARVCPRHCPCDSAGGRTRSPPGGRPCGRDATRIGTYRVLAAPRFLTGEEVVTRPPRAASGRAKSSQKRYRSPGRDRVATIE
jgi:hypothetical protein